MKKYVCLFFIVALNSCFALTQQDQDELKNVIQNYVTSWNEKVGVGFTDNFTDDSDFINIFGMYFHGKDQIEKRHQIILNDFLKGSTFIVVDLVFKPLTEDAIYAMVFWQVDGFHKPGSDYSSEGETIRGVFSHVFIRQKGSWKILATQNTLSRN